ncbi:hypothetical protein BH11ACT8_BH11ACT8_35760 [soil metagenome]
MVTLRAAEATDAEFLTALWAEALRRCDHADQVADVETVIKAANASPEQRLVVAEYDAKPAGAVLLRVSTVSPLNLEPAVQVLSPHVAPDFRRHGVGRVLMESAVAFAEELGILNIATAVGTGSRESNRFMARLALGPHATMRLAPTAAVRARITAQRPTLAASGNGRHLTRVLAARRSMRRSEAAG